LNAPLHVCRLKEKEIRHLTKYVYTFLMYYIC